MLTKIERLFFESLYGYCEGSVEIRVLPAGKCKFLGNMTNFQEFMNQLNNLVAKEIRKNIYFGVATRDGKGGKKENIFEIPAVWCDIDFKDISANRFKKSSKLFPYKPSAIVQSGGGYHLYWFLKEPVGPEDILFVEDINRRIAVYLHGDLNCCDVTRILRVPGSHNMKYNVAYHGKRVEILRINDFRYNLDNFLILPFSDAKSIVPITSESKQLTAKVQLKRVFKCRFIRFCYENQKNLSEPLWYYMLSNVGRLSPYGVSIVHHLSEKYPGYMVQDIFLNHVVHVLVIVA